MATDIVRIDVLVASSFHAALADEAARLDRSLSWVLRSCIERALPELASVVTGSPAHTAVRTSARATSSVKRSFFLPRASFEACGREAERLKLTRGEVLTWAFERHCAPA